MLERFFHSLWYGNNPLAYLFLPLSGLFLVVSLFRRLAYRFGLKKVLFLDKPVIIVGNITVGGTGKTPLVVWLAEYLRTKGFKPGIISRGYGGKARSWPQQVRPDSDPVAVGDEAILLSRRSGCPMAVGPDRYAAGQALLANSDCDILISDDGLQHYRLGRDLEIAVVDGKRRLGNELLLPAGPLREGRWRLEQVDMVLVNEGTAVEDGFMNMQIRRGLLMSLGSDGQCSMTDFAGQTMHAIAGIGNPERFFTLLRNNGLTIIEHRFNDHHAYQLNDLQFDDGLPVIMTEKDAVKCTRLVGNGFWYLQVSAQPDAHFVEKFYQFTEDLANGQ